MGMQPETAGDIARTFWRVAADFWPGKVLDGRKTWSPWSLDSDTQETRCLVRSLES